MNIAQAKAIPLARILATLGHTPTRQRNHELWYLSPFRHEKTASFHVHTVKNSWYDFGIGVGGDGIDLVCTYLKTSGESHTVADALRWLGNMMANESVIPAITTYAPPTADGPVLRVINSRPIEHPALVNYLRQRHIPLALAKRYLKEVRVVNQNTQKRFFALGFPNEDNGTELRTPSLKSCAGPKTVSFIRGNRATPHGIHIFEGFMDFLSALAKQNIAGFNDDVIVLNSLACLNQCVPYIKNYGYTVAYTWFDNDKAGQEATNILHEFFASQENLQHKKMNALYAPHKDVNEYWVQANAPTVGG